MDNRNDVTKAMILLSDEEERKMMSEPSGDEILAAQGLLELSQVIRKFNDNTVSIFTFKKDHLYSYTVLDHYIIKG